MGKFMKRLENKKMEDFLKSHRIIATAKYIHTGSLKGCWRLYNPNEKWSDELMKKLTDLGFSDFDGRPLNRFSGNGGFFSVFVKGHKEFLYDDLVEEKQIDERCNCENIKCEHGENPCKNKAGKHKALYVGSLCDECAEKMPKQYMIESLLWEQDDPKIEELQAKEDDSVVKQKRNAIKRLAKQKGYKLSYWQTANRNARTVYATYGLFPRDEKRPISFDGCEFTMGFTGSPGATSTTRGSEYKALDKIESWLKEKEYFVEEQNATSNNSRWIVLGAEGTHEYNEIKSQYDKYKDDPDVDLFDFTEDAGQAESVLIWGDEMGFKFVEDESHLFGGYFDTRGQSFMGSAASPDFIIMIPKTKLDTGGTMVENRIRIQKILREAQNVNKFKEDEWDKVVYHSTVIAKWNDDEIILNNGGWITHSTVSNMNKASKENDLGFEVKIKNKEMFVKYKGDEISFEGKTVTLER